MSFTSEALGASASVAAPPAPPAECAACGSADANLRMCSSCRVARYCNVACQRRAWPQHKLACAELRAAREKRDTSAACTVGFVLKANCTRCGRGPSRAPGSPCGCFTLWYCDDCGPPSNHSPTVCATAALARFERLRTGAEAGNVVAMHNLAGCFAEGIGTAKSDADNVTWLRRAGDLGWADSLNNLGLNYMRGECGLRKDYVEAHRLLRLAADAGCVNALESLGFMLQQGGFGLAKDGRLAFQYLTRAVEAGATRSFTNLGNAYIDGDGVECDPEKAFATFARGAELGDRSCMQNLSWCYGTGTGVKRDAKKAARWTAEAER